MRCADMVMSAMSYHPQHREGDIARAYWGFVAGWQTEQEEEALLPELEEPLLDLEEAEGEL